MSAEVVNMSERWDRFEVTVEGAKVAHVDVLEGRGIRVHQKKPLSVEAARAVAKALVEAAKAFERWQATHVTAEDEVKV